MYRVLACLTNEHDYRLVALAVLVCISAALTTFMMYSIACASPDSRRLGWAALTGANLDRRRLGWAALTGVCAGSGIWATHFVAMLAYRGSLPTYYDPVATMGSLLVAMALAACGFALATRAGRWMVGVGGAVLGIAIGVMHYVGMRALIVPGELTWDALLVIASLVFGVVFSAAAMLVFHLKTGRAAIVAAGGLLTLAICTLHFTAMGAVILVPDPTIAFQGYGIDRVDMALAVAGVTFVVLLTAFAAAAIQRTNIRFEAVLRKQNSLFEAALRHLPVGLSMFDAEQRLIMCNPAYRRLFDLSEELARPGAKFEDIVLSYVKRESGNEDAARLERVRDWITGHLSKLKLGNVFTETVRLSDGRSIFRRVGPVADGGWVDVHEDVTAVRQSGEKIEWLARHDALTGIANRFDFRERLEHQFECYDPRLGFALHWIDLDHFKEINDQYGHQVGDGYLKSVAHRLTTSLRVGDLVGRLGGDEFAILQVGGGRKDLAEQFAARVLKNISEPHDVLGHKLDANACIGIALAPEHGQDPDHLFASADTALYYAKSHGRAAAVVYESACIDTISVPNPLKAELRWAVERNQLVLHYHPIVDLRDGKVSSFEALMRWNHPNRGMIPPSEFLGLAEETELIVQMGNWAIKQACMDAMTWPDGIRVSVNLSAVQIEHCDFHRVVTEALEATGLEPYRLQLEIAETVLMHNRERTLATLRKLHGLGITIALDDFGTCFGTLNYLRSFPFERIKIDRSFVHDVSEHDYSREIVKSVADLASELNMRSLAEGVETGADLAAVRSAGYDEAQGFYFSVPVPARSVGRIIAQCASKFSAEARGPKATKVAA
jgi:diguanylate cyclase (GGDEF)-like protein